MFGEKLYGYSHEADFVEQLTLYWNLWFSSVICCIENKNFISVYSQNENRVYIKNPQWKPTWRDGLAFPGEAIFAQMFLNTIPPTDKLFEMLVENKNYCAFGSFLDYLKFINRLITKAQSFSAICGLNQQISDFENRILSFNKPIQIYLPFEDIKLAEITLDQNLV